MSGLSRQLARRAVAFVLALALGVTPTMPAFAAAQADNAPAASHAMHESAGVAHAADLHTDHGKAQTAADAAADNNVPCDRHDHHDGKCCATCVQCLTATPATPAMFIPTHSPKLSAVPRLYDRLVVAARDRPPAV